MPTVCRPGPQVTGLRFHELITQRPSTLGLTAQILNTETVFRVLMYTIDRDVDGQERTGIKKKTDRWRWALNTVATMAASRGSPAQGGAALWWAILDGFGSYSSGAMWRDRFAYLEVAVVGEGGRWR
jgi:hypothetical protein